MGILVKIDRALRRVEVWALVVFTALMVSLTFIHVCLRMLSARFGVTHAGVLLEYMDWSPPLARLLVLWLTFVGASLITRDDAHIRIDIFAALLRGKSKKLRYICVSGISFLISLFLAKASMVYIIGEASFGEQIFAGIPVWVAHCIVPLGFLAISFRFLLNGITGISGLFEAHSDLEFDGQ